MREGEREKEGGEGQRRGGSKRKEGEGRRDKKTIENNEVLFHNMTLTLATSQTYPHTICTCTV